MGVLRNLVLLLVLLSQAACASWPTTDAYRDKLNEKQLKAIEDFMDKTGKYQTRMEKTNSTKDMKPEQSIYSVLPKEGSLSYMDMEYKASSPDRESVVGPGGEEKELSLQMAEVELKEFLNTFLQQILNVSYICSVSPKETISVNLDGKFSRKDLLIAIRVVLENMNLAMIKKNEVFHIVPAQSQVADSGDNMHYMLMDLKYVSGQNLVPLLKDVKSETGKVYTIKDTEFLMAVDFPDVISQEQKIIDMFDRPFYQDLLVRLYSLAHIQPEQAREEMQKVIAKHSAFSSDKQFPVQIESLPHQDRLLVLAKTEPMLDFVHSWLVLLDQPESKEIKLYSYKPMYAKVDDLSGVLKNIFSSGKEGEAAEMNIIPDKKTNRLFFRCSSEKYAQVREVLIDLDHRPQQVYVQAVLAEIQLTDKMTLGFDWWFRKKISRWDNAVLELGANTLGTSSGESLTAGFTVNDFLGILKLLISEDQAEIVSTPHILVEDEGEAALEVITIVPFIKSIRTSDDYGDETPSIEQKEVGVKLNVTPEVVNSNEVRLTVEQEQSEKGLNTILGNGWESPEFKTRKMKTQLYLQSGESVLIGGLIEESVNDKGKKVPGLGDAPIVKHLFRSDDGTVERTELVLFLTPTIVREQSELSELSERIKRLYAQ